MENTHTPGDRNIAQFGKQKWKGQSAGEHTHAGMHTCTHAHTQLVTETLHNLVNRSGKGSLLVSTHMHMVKETLQKFEKKQEAAEHQDKQNRGRKGELTGDHLHTQ